MAARSAADGALSASGVTQLRLFGPFRIAATADDEVRFRPGFVGAISRVSSVMSGETPDATATVALTIAGTPVTTSDTVRHPSGATAGDTVDTSVTSAGTFTADQEIRLRLTSSPTTNTWMHLVLECTA